MTMLYARLSVCKRSWERIRYRCMEQVEGEAMRHFRLIQCSPGKSVTMGHHDASDHRYADPH